MKNKQILLYGGKSTALIVHEMLIEQKKKKFITFLMNLLKKRTLLIRQYFQIKKKIWEFLLITPTIFLFALECMMASLDALFLKKLKKKN